MKWRRGSFKGQKVWIAVDGDGMPDVADGRVQVRYNDKPGATVYRAGATRVDVDGKSPVADLDAGTQADDAPKKAAPSRSSSKGSGFGSAGTRTAAQAGLARDAARGLLAGLGADVVRAFTDGSCKGNPGPAGCGALVVLPDGRRGEASQALGVATNNVGELCAVGLALDLLDEAGVDHAAPVALFSDSSYANGVLVKGWKAKANTDLVADLRKRLKAWPNLDFHWVAGHVGIAENERADALANDGVMGRTRTKWIP